MSHRKISKDKYFTAGVITLLIFTLGLTLGFIIDDHRYNLIEEVNMEQDVKYLSVQLQYLYLNAFSNYNNCPILATTLRETIEDLSDSLSEVIEFEENEEVSDLRKQIVMRRYVLDNLRYWLLAHESKQKCDLNIVPILYFYSTDCPSCPNQGTILTYYKKLFQEQVLVFPINLDFQAEEPMIEIMTSQFNVTKYPTIIIDNKKYEGVVKRDRLKEIICSSLDSEQC
jgi:thiol-disulfide isomerase/thioredoxin